MHRRTPVARIVPLTDQATHSPAPNEEDRARIERLVAEGMATRKSDMGALEALRELGGAWPAGHGLLEALRDDRDSEYMEGHR
jgi:hypothetical protein